MPNRTCTVCGKPDVTTVRGIAVCPACKGRNLRKPCPDCGVPIKHNSARCKKCMGLNQRGEASPRWKGGDLNHCVDCGQRIERYSTRCVQCAGRSMRGEASQHWKGGKTHHDAGYVLAYAPGHPRTKGSSPYVFEHVLVAERMLGRPLRDGEVVHHINEVKDDNRPENLHVFPNHAAHMAHHAEMRRAARTHCRSGKHEWIPENVLTRPDGREECGKCAQARQEERNARRRKPRT